MPSEAAGGVEGALPLASGAARRRDGAARMQRATTADAKAADMRRRRIEARMTHTLSL